MMLVLKVEAMIISLFRALVSAAVVKCIALFGARESMCHVLPTNWV